MNNVVLSLTGSAAAGALTLVSPSDWSPRVRRAYVLVPGALVAAGGAVLLLGNTGDRAVVDPAAGSRSRTVLPGAVRGLPVAARTALVLGLGATACALQAASLGIDRVLEQWFVRRGAVHPRRWMAALAVLASLGTDAAGSRVSAHAAVHGRAAS